MTIGPLHSSLRQSAIEHGWQIWWEHAYPSGSHLGLKDPDSRQRMSLTFHGAHQPVRSGSGVIREWNHRPDLTGTIDHCGRFDENGQSTASLQIADTLQAAHRFIEQRRAWVGA